LQTDDCLGSAFLGCGVHFLSLSQVGSEGPFDEDVFACFDAGHEQGVVSVYSDGTDDEVDIWVLGEIVGAAVGFGGWGQVVAFDSGLGGCNAGVAEGGDFVVRRGQEVGQMSTACVC